HPKGTSFGRCRLSNHSTYYMYGLASRETTISCISKFLLSHLGTFYESIKDDTVNMDIKRSKSSRLAQSDVENDLRSLVDEFKALVVMALHQVESFSSPDKGSRGLFSECREELRELSSMDDISRCVGKCQRLFSETLLFNDETERERDELKEIIAILASSISGLLYSSGDFDSRVDECVGRLQQAKTLLEVQEIRESILQQAKGLQVRNRQMLEHVLRVQTQVNNTNKKIETLERQIEKIKQDSVIDPLTKAYNRRAYDKKIKQEIMGFRRYARPTALAIADIDHFKKINDTYGHHVGDMVLRSLSQLMKKEIREVDVLARYGGEEFALILPHTSYERALEVAERIRRKIENSPLRDKEKQFSVTLSFGVGSLKDGDTPESYVERVDKALYRAKDGGRNRVVGEEDVAG
ncbi:MAG: GGDEF domain-containing protein, partial [Deltaproteobacteria bacterium]|nr:GGDEF domain-containing protein [Deltaproteobacteria bacterium]